MERQRRILIVDDEPNVRLMFRTALATTGAEIGLADDGEAALERLAGSPYDLVLLDLRMPGIGGMETLRRLRDQGDETPVVIVTAHGDVPHAVEAMKLGAIDFLSKPMSPDTLRRVVGEVLERHEDGEDEPTPSLGSSPAVAVVVAPPAVGLSAAKRAINRRDSDRAAELLGKALAVAPHSAEALTLAGVLYEIRGQGHAAFHAYKSALEADPHHGPARDSLRHYCQEHGLDFHNKAINPSAGL